MNDESDFARKMREMTDFIKGLQPQDLTAADRAALRSLLDEVDTFVRTVLSTTPPSANA
jgi:hypothetical protein